MHNNFSKKVDIHTAAWLWFCETDRPDGSACIHRRLSPWKASDAAFYHVGQAECLECDWSIADLEPAVGRGSPFDPPCAYKLEINFI